MFKPGTLVSFDTESTGLDVPQKDSPFGVSLCNTELETWYTEWDVDPFTRQVMPVAKDIKYLRKVLCNPRITKAAHNAPFDIMGMQAVDVEVAEPYVDTVIQVKRARSNLFNYMLKPLAKKYLDMGDEDESDLKDAVKTIRRHCKKWGWVPGEVVAQDYWMPRMCRKLQPDFYEERLPEGADELCERYCRLDAVRCMMLHLLMNQVWDDEAREGFAKEMKLMPIVIAMMGHGWQVYPDKIAQTRVILEQEIRQYKKQLSNWALAGLDKYTNHTFAALLYDELEIDNGDAEKPRSVDRAHLEKIDHEVADLILDMRDAEGCINKFLNPFEHLMVKQGKEYVLYPRLNQAGARTFRFSATRPPIQTIPDAGKSKSNMSARQCIGPRKGTVWYMIDYSGLQVRIFADFAQDETMLAALNAGVKPHAAAARICWNGEGNASGLRIVSNTVSLAANHDAVTDFCEEYGMMKDMRDDDWNAIAYALLAEHEYDIIDAEAAIGAETAYAIAKTSFFARLFGAGAKQMAKTLKCSTQEARKNIKEYDASMPRIKSWGSEVQYYAMEHGYVLTPYGDKIHTDPGFEYRAVNYIVQATEAAFVKDRMLAVEPIIKPTTFSLLGQIHDELVFIAPDKNRRSHKPILRKIKKCLEDHTGHFNIDMPCKIDLVEKYWNDRKKVTL